MWKKIYFNKQNIQKYRGNAVVIKLPNKSDFPGRVFYHPAKLLREEGHKGYLVSISFTEDWNFKTYGKSGVLDLSVEDIVEAFENSSYSQESLERHQDFFIHVKEPTKINEEVEVKEELTR